VEELLDGSPDLLRGGRGIKLLLLCGLRAGLVSQEEDYEWAPCYRIDESDEI